MTYYLYFNEVIFLVIIRGIGQKCSKKLKNTLETLRNNLKGIKIQKMLWLEYIVFETYL